MILKDESETGSNDLLAHRREGDVSLSFLISQEHRSCFFRFEGKDLLSLHPAFGGGVGRADIWVFWMLNYPAFFLLLLKSLFAVVFWGMIWGFGYGKSLELVSAF